MRLTLRTIAKDEVGSILVASLVLTFVVTVLGVALFDLALLDNRLALGSEAEYRALELAESGLQSAMYELFLDVCGGDPSCTSPPSNPSWADGTINGTPFPVTTASFASFVPITPVSGSFAGQSYSGSVSVDLKNLTNSEAAGLGLACGGDPCPQLIYARATGNFSSGIGSGTRIVQIIVQSGFNTIGQGLISGTAAAGSLQGNAEIHGSLHILPCETAPNCNAVSFSGGSGIRNNYNGLDDSRQKIIPLLPLVTCPPGTACDGQTVETLGARVRIAYPQSPTAAMDIRSGGITIGEAGSGPTNSYTGNKGKPTMDGVFLGSGCAPGVSPVCSDAVATRPQNVYSDSPIRAYDQNPAPTFPRLDDAVKVFARDYDDYAACSGPGACNVNGDVVSGTPGNKDFFISHAAKVVSTTTADTAYGCDTGPCSASTTNLLTLVTGGSWTDVTAPFSFTFNCTGAGAVACDDADGNRVNGSINGSKPPGFQLEWNNGSTTISVFKCPANQVALCAVPTATLSTGGGAITSGARRYRVSYLDASGNEFDISPGVTVTVLHDDRKLTLQAPVGPAGTQTRRLYRSLMADGIYRRVATFPDNLASTTQIDNVSESGLGSQPVLPAALNEGLLSDPTNSVLPIMVYVDGPLKICEGCNNKTFYYRGHAAFVAKGAASDITSDHPSIAIDPHLLACANPCSAVDHSSFPQKNLFTFYTPGNIFMGLQANRDFMGQFYAGNKWKTTKQTNVLGGVTTRIFDMTDQVPSFWEVKMPFTPTAFPPRGPRLSLFRVRWKECIGPIPAAAC
jgi:type IV pilus assembly PilX-like protein